MNQHQSHSNKVSSTTVWIMAIATGLSVANLYYNQPLLAELQKEFGVSVKEIGIIPTLTQVGYALGMLFLVPMGDMFERRKLIVITSFLVTAALLMAATATSLWMMIAASLLIGLFTMVPQLIIPFAAHLASNENRGKVIGIIMSGLLIGILCSRTVAGFIGDAFGWRVVFYSAAGLMIVLAVCLWFALPASEVTYKGSYFGLIKSIGTLVKEEPTLRESAVVGAMIFGVFSSIWATLIFLLSTPHFSMGAKEVGLFGLLGAAGAMAAPVVGRISDKKGARTGVAIGLTVLALSVLILWGSATSLIGLIVGIFILDFGIQATHISNQTRVFALREDARSRLNTVYMFSYFMGGALGSLIGSYAWNAGQWTGVCIVLSVGTLLATVAFVMGGKKKAKAS
ncbi:MFS transporter [Bdellovibrio sp. SKB1291214]|uniref:MFS transporter n=1 Tax=Bdellovibrio sp. SKB1291214 TaxID=1732569 RepID=UPI001C3E40B5|nr:MFS transporter [Bdellovibrio sp. SKB1291214]UYL08088.1 MFS transporter [Bdellovibrio sp. SKB1291214]